MSMTRSPITDQHRPILGQLRKTRPYQHHHSQRKPLAKSRSEKRPTLNVQSARNFALSVAYPRKLRGLTCGSDGTSAIILRTQLHVGQRRLEKQRFYKTSPPPGIEVVSWYIVMGIGQVVTLRLPPSRLSEVNRVLENTAWGRYRTEFYPTCDYKAVGLEEHDKAR